MLIFELYVNKHICTISHCLYIDQVYEIKSWTKQPLHKNNCTLSDDLSENVIVNFRYICEHKKEQWIKTER